MRLRRLAILLCVYYAALVAMRVLAWDTLELDEAEQLLLTQDLSWGYGSQPPLYTWIQTGVFRVLGPGIPGLALLKFGLLAALMVLALRAARQAFDDGTQAAAAGVGIVFFPEIAWESLRDRSHNILAATAAAATWLVVFRLLARRRTRDFALLGVVVGAGILSKYNYLLVIGGLLAATVTVASGRALLRDRRVLLSAGVCALMVAPHAWWAATHTDVLLLDAGRLLPPHATGVLARRAAGLWTLLRSLVAVCGPPLIVYAAVFRRRKDGGRWAPEDETAILLRRTLLFVVMLAFVAVIAGGIRVRDRWLMPGLLAIPIYLAMRLRPRMEPTRCRALLGVAAVVLAGALVATALSTSLAGRLGATARKGEPYPELIARILAETPAPEVILAGDKRTGGSLRLAAPGSAVAVPGTPLPPGTADGACLVVWNATVQPQPPAGLADLLERLRGVDLAARAPGFVEAPVAGSPTRTLRLAWIAVPR